MTDMVEKNLASSVEAEIDRELEDLIGRMLDGDKAEKLDATFHDLVAQRSRMMRASLLRHRSLRAPIRQAG